jgi:hypothetical protein
MGFKKYKLETVATEHANHALQVEVTIFFGGNSLSSVE